MKKLFICALCIIGLFTLQSFQAGDDNAPVKNPLAGSWLRDSTVTHSAGTGEVLAAQNYSSDYWAVMTDDQFVVVWSQGINTLDDISCLAGVRFATLKYSSDTELIIDGIGNKIKIVDNDHFMLYWSPRPGTIMTEYWGRKPKPKAIEKYFK